MTWTSAAIRFLTGFVLAVATPLTSDLNPFVWVAVGSVWGAFLWSDGPEAIARRLVQ